MIANAYSLFSLSCWDMWEVMGGVTSRMLHLTCGEVLIGRALWHTTLHLLDYFWWDGECVGVLVCWCAGVLRCLDVC